MRLAMVGLAMCAMAVPAFAAKHDKVVVHLKTTGGQNAGTATFEEEKDGKLKVTLNLTNLAAGPHGVHIHEHPACDVPDFKSAGGHFNPTAKMHGFDNPMGHHAGDMPKNVDMKATDTDSTVFGNATFTIDYLTMGTGLPNDILANGGTSIVVHEKADDEKTDPSGASGARVACGIISTVVPQAKGTTEPPPAPDGPVKPKM